MGGEKTRDGMIKKAASLWIALILIAMPGLVLATSESSTTKKESEKRVENLEAQIQVLQLELSSLQRRAEQLKRQGVTGDFDEADEEAPRQPTYKYWQPNGGGRNAAFQPRTTNTITPSETTRTVASPPATVTPPAATTRQSTPTSSTSTSSTGRGYDVLIGVTKSIEQSHPVDGFRKILINADLGNMIKYDRDGFTLFLPSDDALINGISGDRIANLLSRQNEARYFTMFHMIPGQKSLADLRALNGKEMDSVSNTTLTFTVSSDAKGEHIIVNGARIKSDAYQGSNIRIYIVDTVLTP
jgi:Secreted and surface protein containing fasciclin-like repeats